MANASFDLNPTTQERELKRLNDQLQKHIISASTRVITEEDYRDLKTQSELLINELKQTHQKELNEINGYNTELQAICDDLRAQLEQSKANKLSNDELNKQVNVLNIKLQELTMQKQSLEKDLSDANTIYMSAKSELQVHQSELARLNKKLQQMQNEADNQLREFQQKYEAELKFEFEARLEEQKRRAEDLASERVSKLQEEIEYLNLNNARLQEENRAFRDRYSALEQEKDRLEVESRNTIFLSNQIHSLENQNKQLNSKIFELEKRNTRDSHQLALLQQQLAEKDSEYHKLLRELQMERDQNEKLNGEMLKLQNDIELHALQRDQLADLENQIATLRKALAAARNECKNKDIKISELERDLDQLRPTGIAKQVKRYNELIQQIEENPWTISIGSKRRRQTEFESSFHKKPVYGDTNNGALVLQIEVHEDHLEIRNVSNQHSIDLSGWKLKSFRPTKKIQAAAPDKKQLEFPLPSQILKPNQEIRVFNEDTHQLGPNDFVWQKDAWDPTCCKLSLTFTLRNIFPQRPAPSFSAPSMSQVPGVFQKLDTHNYDSDVDSERVSGGEDCSIM